MRIAHIEPWRETRKQLLKKWEGVRVCDEPSPWYMSIPTPFSQLHNVLPEEQEEMVFTELKLFLLGYQTENIRIEQYDDHSLPVSMAANISFDPYIRSELERFHDILITVATIKMCCYAITHDSVTFSPIGAAVAAAVQKKVDSYVTAICTKLDGLSDATQQMNSLFREVHTIHESLSFYSEIVRSIFLEQLIGGQVLTLLDSKRRHVFNGNVVQDLDDVFKAAWKVFAKAIGRLVCKFEADHLDYEFVIWSTKEITENNASKKMMTSNGRQAKSSRYMIVEALCPKFFTKYLDILVRCAEFGDATKSRRHAKNAEKESVENVMEAVRNVDWSNLDVATTVRMLVQFSRKESACLLREIKLHTDVDSAIKDIHELLIKGAASHDVMLASLKADILNKPIDEVGNIRLKKLTTTVLGTASEGHHPFWKYFSFVIDRENVFQMLGQRCVPPAQEYHDNVTPTLFESISVKLTCPIDVEPILSMSAVLTLTPVFRIWLQFHVASWCLANYRDSVRGHMPNRSNPEEAKKKHLILALDAEVSNLKQKWASYVDVALGLYNEKVAKAVSLDEYTECQDILGRDLTKMMGITELSQLENIKDILNIVWKLDNDEYELNDLNADFEEVQSRARMDSLIVS